MTRKFNQYKLQVEEVNDITAGTATGTCGCSCYYENLGGSDTCDNGAANAENGLTSTQGQILVFSRPFVIVGK